MPLIFIVCKWGQVTYFTNRDQQKRLQCEPSEIHLPVPDPKTKLAVADIDPTKAKASVAPPGKSMVVCGYTRLNLRRPGSKKVQ